MLTELSLLQKLWNKGVDISAGIITSTISAAIIAGIATLTWRWKRRRDLKFEADKIDQQSLKADERVRQEARERGERLTYEKDGFAVSATSLTSGLELAELWTNFLDWLQKNELQHLPTNQTMFATHRNFSAGLRHGTAPNVANYANQIARLIVDTELPPQV
jgi:hypothetical protein